MNESQQQNFEGKYYNKWESLNNQEKQDTILALAEEQFGDKPFTTSMLAMLLPFEIKTTALSQFIAVAVIDKKLFKRILPATLVGSINLTAYCLKNNLSDKAVLESIGHVITSTRSRYTEQSKIRNLETLTPNEQRIYDKLRKTYGSEIQIDYTSLSEAIVKKPGTVLAKLIACGKIEIIKDDAIPSKRIYKIITSKTEK
jgi:hypothetical protein